MTGDLSAIQTTPVLVREILDTVPILGAVADRTVLAGQGVNVRLGAGVQTVRAGLQPVGQPNLASHPVATHANAPLRYTLTPALPARLTFEVATRRLQGTGRIFGTPRARCLRRHPVGRCAP